MVFVDGFVSQLITFLIGSLISEAVELTKRETLGVELQVCSSYELYMC